MSAEVKAADGGDNIVRDAPSTAPDLADLQAQTSVNTDLKPTRRSAVTPVENNGGNGVSTTTIRNDEPIGLLSIPKLIILFFRCHVFGAGTGIASEHFDQ